MAEILLYGATSSASYALMAVGFTLVFGVARVLNLAHGAFYACGAYAMYGLCAAFGAAPALAALAAVAVLAAAGAAVNRLFVEPLRARPMAVLMSTLALSIVAEQGLLIAFGSQPRNIPLIFEGPVSLLGVRIGAQRLLLVVVATLVIGALWLFLHKAKLGKAIYATSQDPVGAQLVGIRTNTVFSVVFAVSAAMAALSAAIVGPMQTVSPEMGLMPMIKAFSVVIVGGLGSIGGSIAAALLLGYSETVVAYLVSTEWAQIVSLVAVFVTLVVRPSGLFGK